MMNIVILYGLLSRVIFVDGALKILLLVFVGLPDVQEKIVVGPENVEELITEIDEDCVDCISMHSIG